MGFSILVRCHLYIESGPWSLASQGSSPGPAVSTISRWVTPFTYLGGKRPPHAKYNARLLLIFFPWKMSIWTDLTDRYVLEIISNQIYTYLGLISRLWNHILCLKSFAWTCKLIITTAAPMNLMTNYRLPSDNQLGVKEELAHCGLVTPYDDRDLGQHWFRQWLAAWRHQAITWTNVDLSSIAYSDIHMRAILQEIPQPWIPKISLKINHLKFPSNLPGANEG